MPAPSAAGKRHSVVEKIIGKSPQTGEKRSVLLFAGVGIAILGVYLMKKINGKGVVYCLLYTSPSPRD